MLDAGAATLCDYTDEEDGEGEDSAEGASEVEGTTDGDGSGSDGIGGVCGNDVSALPFRPLQLSRESSQEHPMILLSDLPRAGRILVRSLSEHGFAIISVDSIGDVRRSLEVSVCVCAAYAKKKYHPPVYCIQ